MDMSDRMAKHLTHVRVQNSTNADDMATPATAYVSYNKKYQDPTDSEAPDAEIALVKYRPLIMINPSFKFIY